MSDWLKGPIILFFYFVLGPLIGNFIQGSRKGQRIVFGLMVFITSWHIHNFTLVFNSIETYRGHTKGFEATLIEILAIALIVSSANNKQNQPPSRFWPPGATLYLLYCVASWVSIFGALNQLYALMAGVRFTKALVIYIAAFHFIRDEEDVRWLLKSLVGTLCVQALVVLKMKYVDHSYQVHGWFEHQNPLAMWCYMCGLPLLAACMSKVPKAEAHWYTAGFVASALMIQSSLSRAALLFFAVGVVIVVIFGLIDGITSTRVTFVLGMTVLGAIAITMSLHTIVGRFHDEGNDQSAETRVVMNLSANEMLHHSTFGIGWNCFALGINHPYPFGDIIDDAERDKGHKVDEDYAKGVVESHYWLLLAETGYPGFATYLLFIGVTSWWCLKGMFYWRGTVSGVFLGGLFAALILTYVHSNFERSLTQTKNMSMWLIFLGVAARMSTWRRAARL
jgi:hypothetical protein